MELRSSDAAAKDAQIKLDRKECACGTGQRINYAVVKDVQINLIIEEECAPGMEQRRNYVATKDAIIRLKIKVCATGTGQRGSFAARKAVQIKSSKEECA